MKNKMTNKKEKRAKKLNGDQACSICWSETECSHFRGYAENGDAIFTRDTKAQTAHERELQKWNEKKGDPDGNPIDDAAHAALFEEA